MYNLLCVQSLTIAYVCSRVQFLVESLVSVASFASLVGVRTYNYVVLRKQFHFENEAKTGRKSDKAAIKVSSPLNVVA